MEHFTTIEALQHLRINESSVNEVFPHKGESKEDFISRFMKETKGEYPDVKQRYAVANSYWDRRDESIDEDAEFDNFSNARMWINSIKNSSILDTPIEGYDGMWNEIVRYSTDDKTYSIMVRGNDTRYGKKLLIETPYSEVDVDIVLHKHGYHIYQILNRLVICDVDNYYTSIEDVLKKNGIISESSKVEDGDIKSYLLDESLKSLNESSMLIDSVPISDSESLRIYWDKYEGYVVEKLYRQGDELWKTDFKKTFHDELSAKRYFSRAKKKFGVNESVEDKKIHKFELNSDYLNSIHNLFNKAGEYFKNNPDKDEFEFEFDIDEFRNKIPHFSDKQLNDLAWDYYNDMVDFTRSNFPMYSMNNRNKKYYDPNATAFDKIIVVVKDKDYKDEEDHLDESIYDDDYFKAESEVDGWAQSDADYEKKKLYNDFFEEVLDLGISRKYIKDLYDYYLKRYDYWHKEIYESLNESNKHEILKEIGKFQLVKKGSGKYNAGYEVRENGKRDHGLFTSSDSRAIEYFDDFISNYNKKFGKNGGLDEAFGQQEMIPNFDISLLDKWVKDLTDHELDKWNSPELKKIADTYDYSIGGRYIKVFTKRPDGKARSVFAFVDADGNIYKPAGWNAPAKGVRARIDDNPPLDGYELYSKRYRGIK